MNDSSAKTTTDLLIVGAGPAGLSTALHLCKLDSSWKDRLLVIEKATHPREKLCGGGLSDTAIDLLAELDIQLQVPFFHCTHPHISLTGNHYSHPVSIRIVRRQEFDAQLCTECKNRGIKVLENHAVKDVAVSSDGVEITTSDNQTLIAKALVAADGSLSVVRTKIGWEHNDTPLSALLEILHEEMDDSHPLFCTQGVLADYSPATKGIMGYYWIFPCFIDGKPYTNRGIFDNRMHRNAALKKVVLGELFKERLAEDGIDISHQHVKGFPIRNFNPRTKLSRERVILVGDAAGSDPLFGEGISYALAYGKVAAQSIISAFARNDFSFASYTKDFHTSVVGKNLIWRTRIASLLGRHRWILRMKIGGLLIRLAPWLLPPGGLLKPHQ